MFSKPSLARLRGSAVVVSAALVCLTGCSSAPAPRPSAAAASSTPSPSPSGASTAAALPRPSGPFRNPLPGMPSARSGNVYADAAAGEVAARVRHDPAYLYVPDSDPAGAPTTTVISQRTGKIVRVLRTGELSQHVTPSWDLRRLYVEASAVNQLVQLDPRTGRVVKRIAQRRPYNLYFTPDGRHGIVMDEENNDIAFTDPRTFHRGAIVHDASCRGPNHADFSANGRYFLVTCEFSGSLLKVSTTTHRVLGHLRLGPGSKPQDVRLAPDGRSFYVADMGRDKLLRVSWRRLRVVGHTDMPAMPHGIYPSRDGRFLYVSDRMAGEVSVVSVATNKIVDTWKAPGSHPDMGGVSADGSVLWLSGRYDGYVYGWNTHTGKLVHKIWVGGSPHGLLVWPQPGRYSLGHTGNLR